MPLVCSVFVSKGASRASQVIKWSEVALTNKHLWSGDARVQKVNALYQLRAYAANSLWQLNEQKLVKERSAKNQAKAEDWRGKPKTFPENGWTLPVLLVLIPVKPSNFVYLQPEIRTFVKISITPCVQSRLLR